jgi:hypothetical protein
MVRRGKLRQIKLHRYTDNNGIAVSRCCVPKINGTKYRGFRLMSRLAHVFIPEEVK